MGMYVVLAEIEYRNFICWKAALLRVLFDQFLAGGDVFQPQIDTGLFFLDAAWPQSVHQYSLTVRLAGFVISSFQLNVHSAPDHWRGFKFSNQS